MGLETEGMMKIKNKKGGNKNEEKEYEEIRSNNVDGIHGNGTGCRKWYDSFC